MEKGQTWLKLYRSMLDWEWYDDINTKTVFLHLLLIVNTEDQRRHGIVVPAGSIDRTQEQLAKECGLTRHQLRTALDHLIMTNEVAITRHRFFSVFTMVSWCEYQSSRPLSGQETAKKWPRSGHLNKNNRIIEYRKEKEINKEKEVEDEFDDGWDEIIDDDLVEQEKEE